MGAIPAGYAAGSSVLGKVGGVAGGLLGGLGGLATGITGLIGPLGILTGAAWGLSEIFDYMREQEARKAQRSSDLSSTISNMPMIAQALRIAAESTAGPGGKLALPGNIIEALKSNGMSEQMFVRGAGLVDVLKSMGMPTKDLASKAMVPLFAAMRHQIMSEDMTKDQRADRLEQLAKMGTAAGLYARGETSQMVKTGDPATDAILQQKMLENMNNPMYLRSLPSLQVAKEDNNLLLSGEKYLSGAVGSGIDRVMKGFGEEVVKKLQEADLRGTVVINIEGQIAGEVPISSRQEQTGPFGPIKLDWNWGG